MPIRQEKIVAVVDAAHDATVKLNDLIVTIQSATKRQAEDPTYTAEDALNSIVAMLPLSQPSAAASIMIGTLKQHYKANFKRNKRNAERMAQLREGTTKSELKRIREQVLAAKGQHVPKEKRQIAEFETEDASGTGYEGSAQSATSHEAEDFPAAPFVPFDKRPAPPPMTTAEHEAMLKQLRQDKLDEAQIMADFAAAANGAANDQK